MKWMIFFVIFGLTSESFSGERSDYYDDYHRRPPKVIRGEPYLVQCEHLMEISGPQNSTIEERFVDLAKTKEQMIRLIDDYQIPFSKDFATALLLVLDKHGFRKPTNRKELFALRDLSRQPEQLNPLIWEALDHMVDLKSEGKETTSQVTFLQAKNVVAALKNSPHKAIFEEVMQTVLRFSLLDFVVSEAKNDTWRFNRDYNKWVYGAVWGTGIILGATFGHFVFTIEPPYQEIQRLASGGAIGLVGGVLSSFGVVPAVEDRQTARWQKVVATFKDERDQLNAAQHLNLVAKSQFESVFNFINREQKNGVLTVKETCGSAVCDLTPVQIAYLGHLDLLELEVLKESVKATMKDISVDAELENISKLAHAVKDAPENYASQMRLRLALSTFLGKMEGVLTLRSKAVETLTEYVNSISRANLNNLGEKPYQELPKTEEEIIKNQFLLTKINADLKELDQVKVDNEALGRKVEKSQEIIESLKELLSRMPSNKEGWKEAAEEVLARLDELR